MYVNETSIRVRYADTDQMGYVYYGNYAQYYEVGRVEAMRGLGMTYRSIEENGIIMPVLSFKIKYVKPAFYDDVITIKTLIRELPAVRITFEYETFNEKKELLNMGETVLVFLDKKSSRPCPPPADFIEKLKIFF